MAQFCRIPLGYYNTLRIKNKNIESYSLFYFTRISYVIILQAFYSHVSYMDYSLCLLAIKYSLETSLIYCNVWFMTVLWEM